METVKLGKKGQVSIPKAVLKQVGIEGGMTLLVETTSDGAIILRPAAVHPIEIYSAERVAEFDEADRMDARTAERVEQTLRRKQ